MEATKLKTDPDNYTEAESEFLAATEHFKATTGRKFLRVTDYLKIARRLGYSKNPAATAQSEINYQS